jgi:hypothetical protein
LSDTAIPVLFDLGLSVDQIALSIESYEDSHDISLISHEEAHKKAKSKVRNYTLR